jgi:hypothetical protein
VGRVEIASDRRYRFDLPPEGLWDALGEVGDYPRWWSWLESFDGRRLVAGEVWTCAVRPPLPYVVRFRIRLDDVVERRLITASIAGDLTGTATLTIHPAPDRRSGGAGDGPGSAVRLTSRLAPDRRWLAALASLAHPLVRHGHDWILDTGARQFADRRVRRS